jgi:hypothetical protein
MLVILLLFGVIAGILDTFSSSFSCGGLRVFCRSADLLGSGFSVVFPLFRQVASALWSSRFSPVPLSPSVSALRPILPWLQQKRGTLAHQQKKAPQQASAFGRFNIHGLVRQNINLFSLRHGRNSRSSSLSFLSLLSRGITIVWVHKTNSIKDSVQSLLASPSEGHCQGIIIGPLVGTKQFVASCLNAI